jgi:hypothetical protein
MKTCPFCADLAAPAIVTPPTKASHAARTTKIACGILLVLALAATYFGPDHQRYVEFDRRRTEWHARCDRYVGIPDRSLDAAGRASAQELQEMMAYAKQQGW